MLYLGMFYLTLVYITKILLPRIIEDTKLSTATQEREWYHRPTGPQSPNLPWPSGYLVYRRAKDWLLNRTLYVYADRTTCKDCKKNNNKLPALVMISVPVHKSK